MSLSRKMAVGGSLAVAAHAAACHKWQETLRVHNMFRCMHGMPDLVWDEAIAATAQAWADQGKDVDADPKLGPHSPTPSEYRADKVGENIAMMSNEQFDGAFATKMWYDEILFTPSDRYGKPRGPQDKNPLFSSKPIGHYTAMIWKDATKLGCGQGTVRGQGPYSGSVLIVCQYGIDGGDAPNTRTYGTNLFDDPDQVAGPSKTYEQCKAKCPDHCEQYVPEDETCVPGKTLNTIHYCESLIYPWSVYGNNDCIPSVPLPNFSPCVHGYQCESKTCSPGYRVCVTHRNDQVAASDLNIADAAKKTELEAIITGGVCSSASMNLAQCRDFDGSTERNSNNFISGGSPKSTWDQAQCGCKEEYMEYYNAGTWVAQNDNVAGLVCTNSQDFTCTAIAGEYAFPSNGDGEGEATYSGSERKLVLASFFVAAAMPLVQVLV